MVMERILPNDDVISDALERATKFFKVHGDFACTSGQVVLKSTKLYKHAISEGSAT